MNNETMRVPSSLVFSFIPDKRKIVDLLHVDHKGVKKVVSWGRDVGGSVESNGEAAQRSLDDRGQGAQASGTPWEACHSQPTDISAWYLTLKLIHWTWSPCLSLWRERWEFCLSESTCISELQNCEVEWVVSPTICTSGAQSYLFQMMLWGLLSKSVLTVEVRK